MLGDVASHGFSAALVMALVMSAAGIHATASVTPDETLTALLESLSTELTTTEMYFSVFYGVLDPLAGRLSYANAGHPYAFRVPRVRRSGAARGHSPAAGSRHARQHAAPPGAVVGGPRPPGALDRRSGGRPERGRRAIRRAAAAGDRVRARGPTRPRRSSRPCSRRPRPSAHNRWTTAPCSFSGSDGGSRQAAPGPAFPHRSQDSRPHRRRARCRRRRHGARDRPGSRRAHRTRSRPARAGWWRSRRTASSFLHCAGDFPTRRSSRATRSRSTGAMVAGPRFLVAGNIPYNITSPLIDKALEPPPPTRIVFLVQKEVADRVTAGAGERAYGALSVGVQSVARAERLFTVPAGAFHPRPKVDSAVLRLVAVGGAAGRPTVAGTAFGGWSSACSGFGGSSSCAGLRELTGWEGGRWGTRCRVRGSGRTCARRFWHRRSSPRCTACSLTEGGRRGSFVKCFTKMPAMRKVAESTVRRLSLYLRFLEEFEVQGIDTVSSGALASRGQHDLGAGAQGSLVLRLVRQAGPRVPGSRAGRPAAGDPGSQAAVPGRHDRGGEDRQRAGAIPRVPPARLRHRRHLRSATRPRSDGSGTGSRCSGHRDDWRASSPGGRWTWRSW